MDTLISDLKIKIIELLNLEHLKPEQIGDDDMLFGDEIGLDSIDALELIVLLEREYGLKIASKEDGKEIFQSIKTIAQYIKNQGA